MKGQTIIELKDVKTGKIERHVDNNMMTNAIAEIFKTRGLMMNNGFTQDNLVKACLGGILLFDSTLTESVNNVFPPTSVTMVGNGAMDVVSTDEVTEMGSYNSNESGWQNDGSFLAVYDFSTSQANGTIASVCLTSDIGGYVGFGNWTSNKRKTSTRNLTEYAGRDNNTIYSISGNLIVRMDYTNSTVDVIPQSNLDYSSADFFMTTKKLKIDTYKIPMSKLSLNTLPSNLPKVRSVEVGIPDGVSITYYLAVGIDSVGNIYIYPKQAGTWSDSGVYSMYKINTNNQASVVTILNTTGRAFGNNQDFKCLFSDNYMIYINPEVTDRIYRFNLTDSSSTEILNADTYTINSSNIGLNQGGYIYLPTQIINVNEGIVNYHNGGITASVMQNATNHPLIKFPFQAGSIVPYMSAMYLASINNLEQAVTKTADKTMKVSYRIMF
jgi:hypothetical protein